MRFAGEKRTKTVPGIDLATSHHLLQGRRGERAARQGVDPVRRGVTPPHRTAHSAGAAAYWSVPTARGQPSASLRAQSRQAAATGRSVKLRTRSAEETGKGGRGVGLQSKSSGQTSVMCQRKNKRSELLMIHFASRPKNTVSLVHCSQSRLDLHFNMICRGFGSRRLFVPCEKY